MLIKGRRKVERNIKQRRTDCCVEDLMAENSVSNWIETFVFTPPKPLRWVKEILKSSKMKDKKLSVMFLLCFLRYACNYSPIRESKDDFWSKAAHFQKIRNIKKF